VSQIHTLCHGGDFRSPTWRVTGYTDLHTHVCALCRCRKMGRRVDFLHLLRCTGRSLRWKALRDALSALTERGRAQSRLRVFSRRPGRRGAAPRHVPRHRASFRSPLRLRRRPSSGRGLRPTWGEISRGEGLGIPVSALAATRRAAAGAAVSGHDIVSLACMCRDRRVRVLLSRVTYLCPHTFRMRHTSYFSIYIKQSTDRMEE